MRQFSFSWQFSLVYMIHVVVETLEKSHMDLLTLGVKTRVGKSDFRLAIHVSHSKSKLIPSVPKDFTFSRFCILYFFRENVLTFLHVFQKVEIRELTQYILLDLEGLSALQLFNSVTLNTSVTKAIISYSKHNYDVRYVM